MGDPWAKPSFSTGSGGGNVNIGGDAHDEFHRYKMPKLIVKVEGSGKMIKTFVPNLTDLAGSLSVQPDHILKFLGYMRNVNTNLKAKYISGSHNARELQEDLGAFINIFVLCPSCGLPETNWEVGSKHIYRSCQACNHSGKIKPPPSKHQEVALRLIEFIVKAAGATSKSKKSVKDKRREKQRRAAEAQKAKERAAKEAEERAARKAAGGGEGAGDGGGDDDDDDDDWADDADVAAAAEAKAKEKEERRARKEAARKAAEEELARQTAEAEAAAAVAEVDIEALTEKFRGMIVGKDGMKEQLLELKALQDTYGFGAEERLRILFFALFNENLLKQLVPRAKMLGKLVTEGNAASQRALLGTLEEFVGIEYPALLPKTAHVLKLLYDRDLLEEEVICAWARKEDSAYVTADVAQAVRAKAMPFVTWLEEADEEESSDEE